MTTNTPESPACAVERIRAELHAMIATKQATQSAESGRAQRLRNHVEDTCELIKEFLQRP